MGGDSCQCQPRASSGGPSAATTHLPFCEHVQRLRQVSAQPFLKPQCQHVQVSSRDTWLGDKHRKVHAGRDSSTDFSRIKDDLHCCCSSHGGFVQTSSSTMRDYNDIQETTHSSYDGRTGQQQSLHSRQLPDRVRSSTL